MALTGLASWHPPSRFPFKFHVLPQPSLILMAFLVSVLAGVLFGVMPLRQIFKTDPNEAIKSGGSQSSAAGRRWALRDVLLAAQIALCCVTVTAAFVSLRGLGKALTMDLGFKPKNAVLTTFDLSQAGYTGDAADHFQRQLLERVSQMPGVDAAGYANTTPLSLEASMAHVFSQQTSDFRPSNKAFDTYFYEVSPGYLAAAGTPLLEGRDVSFSDTAKTPPVADCESGVRPAALSSPSTPSDAILRTAPAYRSRSWASWRMENTLRSVKIRTAAVFYPISQKPDAITALVVRTGRDTGEMVSTIRKVISDLDSAVPIRQSGTWNSQITLSLFPSQVATVALGIFGAFGLLLSIAGTFGLASYTVSKRMRELSIRVALGAQAKQILSAALGRMLILLGSGCVVGLVLGVAASRLLSAVVYQASVQDPFVLAAVVFTIVLTGALSVVGPVRRVLHLDPAYLLREQ